MRKTSDECKTVVYMTEPEARFVSLVKRGANRTPFRIVKHQKEKGMKIIQRIVTRKGTDVAAVKAAVGSEAAEALNLFAPQDSGAFTLYEQHPENAFKADSLDVIALSDDNSIICVCGEMAEKSEGFSISRLLAKKEQRKCVEVPDSISPIAADVLKSSLSDDLWKELDAVHTGINSILAQSEGEAGKKVEMVRELCDNFIASLETAISIMKSEDFAPKVEGAQASEGAGDSEQKSETTSGGNSCLRSSGGAEQSEASQKSAGQEQAHGEIDEAFVAGTAARVLTEIRPQIDEIFKSQSSVLEELKLQLGRLGESVAKMEKAPAGVVPSHEDSCAGGNVVKAEAANVFSGCFGNLGR